MMKEIPILFSTPMVQAILDGRKLKTRRLLLRALNKYRFKSRAFAALGVSEKQGYNLIKLHEVQWSEDKGYYSEKVIEFIKIDK